MLPAAEVGASGWQRDVAAFDLVEINSSFYRQVRPSTCEKWAGEVAPDFLFALKMHRLITHDTRLKNTALLENFFHMVAGLGRKLAVVLVQLPPTLTFDHAVAETFFAALAKPLVAARFAHFSPPMPRRAGRSPFPAAVADSMTQTLRLHLSLVRHLDHLWSDHPDSGLPGGKMPHVVPSCPLGCCPHRHAVPRGPRGVLTA
ncbi:MAG: DUF72 domain-containing protein [Chthoniobacterales bacterium]|nr:DUF72 domain-containing protein [Chthoniobacterales bacterium]